jgi:hypothetical protein
LAALRQKQRNKQIIENERNIKRKVRVIMALIKVKERKVTHKTTYKNVLEECSRM